MALRIVGGGVATQAKLAEALKVTPEHLSRTLRCAREAGETLPPRGHDPETGAAGWLLGEFITWWWQRPKTSESRLTLTADDLRSGVADGLDETGIAARHQVGVRAVRRAADRWGVHVPTVWELRRREVVTLSRRGLSAAQIIERTGYGNGTVYRWLREAGRGSVDLGARKNPSKGR